MPAAPETKPESRATVRSGQKINSRLPRLSGVTAAPTAVIVLLNRRRKRPIRVRLNNNLKKGGGGFVPVQEGRSRGEGMETAGEDKQGRGEVWASKGSQPCLDCTFFLFLRVAVALILDEAGAG